MDSKIKVALRCRHFLANESNKRRVLNFSTDAVGIGDKKYQFEQVFDEKSSQSDVYEFCVKSLVDGCFEGYNGTVFACKNLHGHVNYLKKRLCFSYFLIYRWTNRKWKDS